VTGASTPALPAASARTFRRAILRAVGFLRRRQLPHGEFVTLLGADRQFSSTAFESSPFTTSFVLYALAHVDRAVVGHIAAKGAAFLLSEMEFGGVWRYWSTRQHKHHRLPPDIDDTACISYALKSLGRSFPNNGWVFDCTRDPAGRFRTWILPNTRNRLNPWFWFARAVGFCQARLRTRRLETPADEDPRFRVMHIDLDDVDPVVNANVVLYLGERPDTLPAIDLIIDTVLREPASWSLYYEDVLGLYYAVARAFRHSAPRLSAVREHIVSRIAERARDPESLNPLQAAMAASALLTFEPGSEAAVRLVHRVLDTQRSDGGWDAYAFYNVWGSEELTTALCLEVLARFEPA
jgi:hypothetical protein